MKVSANELRVGNILEHQNENGKFTVRVVSIVNHQPEKYFIQCKVTDHLNISGLWGIDPEQLSGIPLTDEWLIKVGFEIAYESEFTIKYHHCTNNKFSYKFNLINGKYWLEYYGGAINCKTVNQLQNIYFALTGEELTIK